HERRSQLEIAHRLEQSLDLRAGKNRRQTIRPAGRRNLRGDIRPPQGRAIEEAQRRPLDGGGVGPPAEMMLIVSSAAHRVRQALRANAKITIRMKMSGAAFRRPAPLL